MKIAVLHGPRDLRVEDQPLQPSRPGPGQVYVRTQLTGFKIGTDRGNFEGAEAVPGAPLYPRSVGDMNLGVIEDVGDGVDGFAAGDRVLSSMSHRSQFIARPRDVNMLAVPDGAAAEDAVFAGLYSLSAHCFHRGMFRAGETVAVVGLGTLGLGAVAIGPLIGARIIAIGNSSSRIESAMSLGAHAALDSSEPDLAAQVQGGTEGDGADLVILTANPWPAYRKALEIVRTNGRVAIVSLLGRGEDDLTFNPLSMPLFWIRGLTLIAVGDVPDASIYPSTRAVTAADTGQNRHRAMLMDLMAQQKLRPSALTTHRLPYDRMAEAYDMAYARDKSMMNVIFDWRDA